MEIDLITRNSK